MKVQTFEIEFADAARNPNSVYHSGQLVTFNVHLKLLQPVKCRAVYASLHGSSNVHWSESRSSGSGKSRRSRTVHYRSEEIYIDQTVAVYTPPSDGPLASHHPAGEFYYPVTFQLPATAPSSFEGGIGKIRYRIRANIDRPWRFDTVTQKMYTVIRDLDLNLEPGNLIGPHSTSDEYDVNFCSCFTCCFGQVRVSIDLDKKGFVPGESVRVGGELVNTSSVDLDSVSLELYQKILFHAEGKTRTTTRVTATAELPGLQRRRSMPLSCLLCVPPLPSSRIDGCNNIEAHYYLRVRAGQGAQQLNW
uniref:Arrestin_C domain-containing protein n=1 Tax=Macrostomum lignano TaxID=282301 RepID=A0A1I8I189_9PLAT